LASVHARTLFVVREPVWANLISSNTIKQLVLCGGSQAMAGLGLARWLGLPAAGNQTRPR
jgi:hypothetical protein